MLYFCWPETVSDPDPFKSVRFLKDWVATGFLLFQMLLLQDFFHIFLRLMRIPLRYTSLSLISVQYV
jgi:hypothetical protein